MDLDARTAPLLPRDARHAAGRALRKTTRRGAHAAWQPAPDRADPVRVLEAQGARRIASLLPIRYRRMSASPLAFLRGAAAVMAADLATMPVSGLRVQSCGDCHLANFGSYATPEGMPVFDINDFDETLPAPFEWDVKRLATSLVLSGRDSGLSPLACGRLALDAVQAYRREIARLARMTPLEAWSVRVDLPDAIDGIADPRARHRARVGLEAQMRSGSAQYGLLDEESAVPRLREQPPLVMRMTEHEAATREAFARYADTLSPERRLLLQRYRLEDVVFKVVGIGSVGTFCAIGLFATAEGEPLLLQIKEAQASVLEPFAGASEYRNSGERVVSGQRMMQAASDLFLGWTHTVGNPGASDPQARQGRQYYVRSLKDARLAALGSQIEQHGIEAYASLCGRTLGRAHARSGDTEALSAYVGRGRRFARAVATFAERYADQTEQDWQLFTRALEAGRLPVASV